MTTMMEGEAGPSTIPLYLINGVATIWDAQSMFTFLSQSSSLSLSLSLASGVQGR